MNKLESYDENHLTRNPFTTTLLIPISVVRSGKFRMDGEDLLPDTYPIERTQHVKIFYTTGVKESVYNLTDAAMRLFNYILFNLEPNKDFVQINQENYMSKNSIRSINTFKKAKSELIRHLFIVPTEYKTVFWINPEIFFPGNRINKYPDNCRQSYQYIIEQ